MIIVNNRLLKQITRIFKQLQNELLENWNEMRNVNNIQ
jgi:hypothetical protein